jgi:hypothetical protein
VNRAVVLAILAACSSKPTAQEAPGSGSGSGSTAAKKPTADAWYQPPVLWDAPPPPPPDGPAPPTRAQFGTVVATTPAIALALDGGKLYALSAIDAVVVSIDTATGAVTPIDKDPEKRGLPGGIVAGPDGLYWDEQKRDDCTIVHADPAKQVAPATIAVGYGEFGPLAQDAKQLFVAGRRGLDRIDKKTANNLNVGTTRLGVRSFAIDADRAYWLDRNADGDTSIMAAKKTGGDPVQIAKSPDIGKDARWLLLDGNTFYWSRGADLVSMPKAGGAVKVIVTSKAIGELIIAGPSFYWIENNEAIGTAPKAGGEVKILGNADFAAGLVSDGKTLYWGTPFDVRKLTL